MLKDIRPKDLTEVIRQVHAGKKRIPAEVAAHLAGYSGDDLLTDREIDVGTSPAATAIARSANRFSSR